MAQVAIGIDLGGTDIKAGLVNTDGEVLDRWKKSTEAHGGAEVILGRMFELTGEVLEYCTAKKHEVQGVGIGSPGVIDHKNGIVVKMIDNLPGWSGMRLAERFEEKFGLPTRLDNDANVCALAEAMFGAGKGKSDMLVYTIGTGVGGGIIIGGKVHHGAHGYAGELGHDTVDLDGPECSCGNLGCIETYASAKAIGLRAQQLLKEGRKSVMRTMVEDIGKVTSKVVHDACLEGDELAKEVVVYAARRLGAGIASAICVLDPEMIIIGGGGSNMGDVLLDPVREEVAKRVYFYDSVDVPVVCAELGNDAGFVGAAGLIFSR